jgi:hypothetical protein
VIDVSVLAYNSYLAGKVVLTQRKRAVDGEYRYEYLAVKRAVVAKGDWQRSAAAGVAAWRKQRGVFDARG